MSAISGVSGKSKRKDVTKDPFLLSQDSTNRAIALRQYQPAGQPNLVDSLLRQAEELKVAGQYEQALEQLQHLPETETAGQSLQAMMQAAEILSMQGHYTEALQSYQNLADFVANIRDLSLSERSRMLGLVLLNQAWVLSQLGRNQSALENYDQAIIKLESVQEDFQEEILPSLMMAFRQRGITQRLLGYLDAALQDLERSTYYQERLLKPIAESVLELVSSWFSLARQQQEIDHWEQALESLDQALKLSADLDKPEERKLWAGMIQTQRARCFEQNGALNAALHVYESALRQIDAQVAPRQWVLLRVLRAGLAFQLKQADALTGFEAVRQSFEVLEEQGQTEELAIPLLALAGLATEQEPQWALEFYNGAIRCLERANKERQLEYQPFLIDAYRGRGNLLADLAQPAKALASLKQARRLAEHTLNQRALSELDLQLGLVLQACGRPEQALESYSQAAQSAQAVLSADSVGFRAIYFQAYILANELNRAQEALSLLEDLDRRCPEQVDYDLACLYARLGQPEQALEHLQKHLASPQSLSLDEILADPDLAVLQTLPSWQALLAKIQPA